jgi:hypothetical protein
LREEFPAFVVVNKQRTKLKIVKGIDFMQQISKLIARLNLTDDKYDTPYRLFGCSAVRLFGKPAVEGERPSGWFWQ